MTAPSPATAVGRIRARALAAIAAVRSHLFWRVLYWTLSRETTVRAAAAILRAGDAEAALNRLSELLVWSGWPAHAYGWTNVDLSRFAWSVRRRLVQARATSPRPAREGPVPLRVAIVGEFARVVNFSRTQLSALPEGIELSIFDIGIRGNHAHHLSSLPRYHAVPPLAGRRELEELAASIDSGMPDMLLIVTGPPDSYAIADAVRTPCIANVCTGSDLLHHPRVAFNAFFQPQADYFAVRDRLFCGTSRSFFGDARVYDGFLVNDLRDIQPGPHATWDEREPLLVVHGSLYKVATEPYLSLVLRLLSDDGSLEWVLMGRDDGGEALDVIMRAAARYGVSKRVRYEGAYTIAARTADGRGVEDEGWTRLLGHLRQARLVPDPFPIPGGASRVEAYAMGAPVTHMSLRTDASSWARPQHAAFDLNGLSVPSGSATTLDGYLEITRRCVSDRVFARALVAEQLSAVARVTDVAAWWGQMVEFYDRWLRDCRHNGDDG